MRATRSHTFVFNRFDEYSEFLELKNSVLLAHKPIKQFEAEVCGRKLVGTVPPMYS